MNRNRIQKIMHLLYSHRNVIPLLGLSVLMGCTLFRILTEETQQGNDDAIYTYVMTSAHIIASLVLTILLLVYCFLRKAFKILLIAAVVAGVFNFYHYTLSDITFQLEISALHISFQPLSAGLAILYLIINTGYLRNR